MKLRLLVICLLCLATAPFAAAGEVLRSIRAAETLDVSPVAFEAEALRGRPVAVVFFASWCPPCIDEFAEIAKVKATPRGKKLAVVGVNLFENWGGGADADRMSRFLERTRPGFPLIRGNAEISAAFGTVDRIPTLVVLDADGRETWRFVHARGATKTHAAADEILAAIE